MPAFFSMRRNLRCAGINAPELVVLMRRKIDAPNFVMRRILRCAGIFRAHAAGSLVFNVFLESKSKINMAASRTHADSISVLSHFGSSLWLRSSSAQPDFLQALGAHIIYFRQLPNALGHLADCSKWMRENRINRANCANRCRWEFVSIAFHPQAFAVITAECVYN